MHTKLLKKRVIYQNQFLYTSSNAVGPHFLSGAESDPDGTLRNSDNAIKPLIRVQSLDYGFKTNFLRINEYGQAANVSSASLNNPDISCSFEYLLLDGYNEGCLDFITNGIYPALHPFLSNEFPLGRNLFFIFGPAGYDLIGADLASVQDRIDVVAIGNAFLTQYAITAEVGSLPRARVAFEGFNIRSYSKEIENLTLPSIEPSKNCAESNYKFSIPDVLDTNFYTTYANSYNELSLAEFSRGILPGSIRLDIDDGSLITKQNKGENSFDQGGAHVQGFTINFPLGSTRVKRMGNVFDFARVYNFPSTIEVKITAFVSELKSANLLTLLCQRKKHNIVISMHDYCSVSLCQNELKQEDASIVLYLKGAVVDAEAFNSSIDGSSKLVEISLSLSVASPESNCEEGFFMFGKSFFPSAPKIVAWGKPL